MFDMTMMMMMMIGVGSLEDKGFGAFHPQFWRIRTATEIDLESKE